MPVDGQRAAEELFAHEHGLQIYAAIANYTKSRFSTTELAQVAGVSGSYVSKEVGCLRGIGLVRKHSKNDYERVDDVFWTSMAALAEAWNI